MNWLRRFWRLDRQSRRERRRQLDERLAAIDRELTAAEQAERAERDRELRRQTPWWGQP